MSFMQTAPWLGLVPGADGKILHSQDGGDSPIVNLFKSAAAAVVSNPEYQYSTSFNTMSKQSEAAGNLLLLIHFQCSFKKNIVSSRLFNIYIISYPLCPSMLTFQYTHKIVHFLNFADLLYKANLNTGSVLEYALAFTSAALDKYCTKWSASSKTGFIDITTSRDFYRIYSGLQIVRNPSTSVLF